MSTKRTSKAAARAAQRRHKRALESKRKNKARIRNRGLEKSAPAPSRARGRSGNTPVKAKTIDFPENFSLHSNYETVLETLNEVTRTVSDSLVTRHRRLSVNFTNIKNIDLASSLLLAAEVDVWQIKKGKLKAQHEHWRPQIRALMTEMGFFALLNIKPPKPESTDKEISFIKFLSGRDLELTKAMELRINIEKAMGKALSQNQKFSLFASLTEAVINVRQHAYESADKSPSHKLLPYEKWWITAAYARENGGNKLTVAIYDRGLTIPKTMQVQEKFKELIGKVTLGRVSQDSVLIEAAVREAAARENRSGTATRTRTKKPYRGRGLKELLQLIALEKGGEVHIISGKGRCCFTLEPGINGALLLKYRHESKNPLRGTLVEWRIDV